MRRITIVLLVLPLLLSGCDGDSPPGTPPPDRESLIPEEQVKITPETDVYPVLSLTDEYQDPVPLPYPVNTAGAEDSAFITPDGNTLYVWFTPDVSKPPEQQLVDGVTGIYVLHKNGDIWGPAERIWLQDPGKLALDGCEFVLGNRMWFCSAREGYTGIHWFTAELLDGVWANWTEAEFDPAHEVGELHISGDGSELYFHSMRAGGQGSYDLWVSRKEGESWGEPQNLAALNSSQTDGWPFLSQDGRELWFTRGNGAPALFRAKRVNGEWGAPEQMFSHFSGEASLDQEGNLYFTHHFYQDDQMLEADIYFARRR